MAKVRYQGTKPEPPRPDSWDDPYRYMDLDFWMNDRPGDYFKQGFDPNDNRTISQRLKDAWGAGMAAAENFKGVRFPYWAQNFQGPAQGALTLWAAGAAALGTKDWRKNWSGQAQPAQATYQGSQYNQPAVTQYNQAAAGVNLSNADRLRIQQENLIANRKAQRLAELATAPAWVQQAFGYTPGASAYQAPTQGYYQAPTYQGAPAQSFRQAQGNYQPAGNPYAGRVDPSMRRGPNWEKQHNRWVQLRRRARLGVK